MKWIYVALIVPILSLALAPGIAGSGVGRSFASPSGNIHCQATGLAKVTCTTAVPFRTVTLDAGHRAVRVHPPIREPRGPIVVYGDAWGGTDSEPFHDVQCASEYSGMICTDFLTHGFTISRGRVQTW